MAKKPKEHWLHIDEATGREEVFDAPPPPEKKSLKVWSVGRHELTKTYNITVLADDEKGKGTAKSVKPKGEGWELHHAISDMGSTTWRRRRRRAT